MAAYNLQGKRTSLENLAGQVTTTAWDCCFAYGYNEKSELTNAVAAVDSDYRYSYAFDESGNRETSSERGTNSVYYMEAVSIGGRSTMLAGGSWRGTISILIEFNPAGVPEKLPNPNYPNNEERGFGTEIRYSINPDKPMELGDRNPAHRVTNKGVPEGWSAKKSDASIRIVIKFECDKPFTFTVEKDGDFYQDGEWRRTWGKGKEAR